MTSEVTDAWWEPAREHRLPSGARVQVWDAVGPPRAMVQL
ncbi:hypothetical protein HNR57_007143 [Streptomyces paradoxus]|uniref:Uncharacterized protein n=1 Tax=Streptomyces paradoxus TaxID=66375 RepID=A0A7W9TK92_9ACTN|nr:hypothetical protein [Streptomyces paradoxus]